jgi:hypothetical protein
MDMNINMLNLKGLTRQQVMVIIAIGGLLMFFFGFGKQLAMIAVLAVLYLLWSGKSIEGMFDGAGFIRANPARQSSAEILGEIKGRGISEIGEVDRLHAQITEFVTRYVTSAPTGAFQHEFTGGLQDKLDYYILAMYNGIGTLLADDIYPQHIMVNIITAQRRILNILQDFVFVDHGSHLNPELQRLRDELAAKFDALNSQIVEAVNNKDSSKINNLTGYLDHPSEPVPAGVFTDTHTLF